MFKSLVSSILFTTIILSGALSFAKSSASRRSLARATDMGRDSSFIREMRKKDKNEAVEKNNESSKRKKASTKNPEK